jgi:tRNA(Ile)-lysidine synthase
VNELQEENFDIENQIKIDIQNIPREEIDNLHQAKNIALIDNDKIFGNLIIRKAEEGDKFIPFGMKTHKKLSRFFIDEKMSKFEKETQFLLCDDRNIVWVIGRRIDQRYAVDGETTNILKLVHF